MFEISNTAFLPELLIEITRAKNCRKASFRKKMNNIEPACFEQNTIRSLLKKVLPKEIKHIEDNYYGVDYKYKGITIDQKFSFGELGNNTIKIRVRNRELINKAEWTMIINKDWEMELFQTKKLAAFVRRNWGIVQRGLVEKRQEYNSHSIRLEELYKFEEITPIKTKIEQNAIFESLEEAILQTNNSLIEETLFENKTILDQSKRICFEPSLAQVAKQILQ